MEQYKLGELPELVSELKISDLNLIEDVKLSLEQGIPAELDKRAYLSINLECQSKLVNLRSQIYYLLSIYTAKKAKIHYDNMCSGEYDDARTKEDKHNKMMSDDPVYYDMVLYSDKIKAVYDYVNSLCFTLKSACDAVSRLYTHDG